MKQEKKAKKSNAGRKKTTGGYVRSRKEVLTAAEKLDLDNLKNPTKEGLTPKEEKFCEIYVSPTEFYGNGTQSYIEAFDVILIKGNPPKEKDKDKKYMTYESVREAARKLLTRGDILLRINENLEKDGFNDENVDKQLSHLILQKADPRVSLGAIQEYNKLKQRIHERQTVLHAFAYDEMSDDELQNIIETKTKFFKKE